MPDIEICTDNFTVTVRSPYDGAFVDAARKLNGRWDREGSYWQFAARDLDRVTALCRDIYGSDGSDAADPPVMVRIPVTENADRRVASELRLAGRRLAVRTSRDADVRLADNVVLISGDFASSGGSVRYPELNPLTGTVIEVRDLPLGSAKLMQQQWPGIEIIDSDAERRAALLAEASRLRTRLAEVTAEIGNTGVTAERRANGEVIVHGVVPAFETNPKGLLFDTTADAEAVAYAILGLAGA